MRVRLHLLNRHVLLIKYRRGTPVTWFDVVVGSSLMSMVFRFAASNMAMAARLLLVVAVASVATAYSNTSPVVAWSSSRYFFSRFDLKKKSLKNEISSSYSLDSLPARLDDTVHSASLLENIVNSGDACNHDAVIIIDQPGVRVVRSPQTAH